MLIEIYPGNFGIEWKFIKESLSSDWEITLNNTIMKNPDAVSWKADAVKPCKIMPINTWENKNLPWSESVGGGWRNDLKQTEDSSIHHCWLQLFYPTVFILFQKVKQWLPFVSNTRYGRVCNIIKIIWSLCPDEKINFCYIWDVCIFGRSTLLPGGGQPCLPAFCRGGHWSVMPANEGKQETHWSFGSPSHICWTSSSSNCYWDWFLIKYLSNLAKISTSFETGYWSLTSG